MNLRSRFALVTAGIVLVLSVVLSAGAYGIATRQLRAQIDDSLASRATRILAMLERPGARPDSIMNRDLRDEILQTELDAITQLNIPGVGPVARVNSPVIPTSEGDEVMRVQTGSLRYFRFDAVNGTSYRALTIAADDGVLVQVAKDLSIVNDASRGMRLWFPAFTALAVALSGAVGWFFARRISRPLENLAVTADRIAHTRDPNEHIDHSGADEVGRLSGSFNTMLAALRDSLERQRRLVQDAGHELRTPLTSLRANTELLERDGIADTERASILADMRAEIDELVSLGAELSALASDQTTMEQVEDCDLADIADEVASRANRRAGTGSSVTVHRSDDTVVQVRPLQLERAVTNLVDNALKFAGDGARVEIHVGARRIEVRDNGPGISSDDKSHVWERFWRAESGRALPGSGLGLAIVRQFADDHGASAYVLDNVGGGAIVGIQFPLDR